VDSATVKASALKRRALVRISLIIIMMLMIPVFLYTVAPEDPVKEGMVVYTSARQRAYFEEPERYQTMGYTNYCILEPHDSLMIVRTASDGSLAARSDTKSRVDFPFCPPHAIVIVQTHQVTQKQSLWQELKKVLASLFGT